MRVKSLKSKKGFTLIELMIVVAIIGILAAVALPKFADLVTRSKEASTKGSIGAVRSALSIYYSDTEGIYPFDLYAGLTNANKYMPALAGIQSLGRYEIPKNKQGNPGHTSGFYFNLSAAGGVTMSGAGLTVDDATPLSYSSGGVYEGDVALNCSHTTSKSSVWSAF